MLDFLLTSLIFDANSNMTKKQKNQAATSPDEKSPEDVVQFTCPHCNETYDIDYIDDEDMLCPVCGLDLEDDYDLELDEELAELYQAVGEMKEYIENLESQIEKMNKRLKNLESK